MDQGPAAAPAMMVMVPIKIGARKLEPGDRYSPNWLGDDERTKRLLLKQRNVGPITAEAYRNAIRRRPPNTIGKGWTVAQLVSMGIISAGDGPRDWQPPEGSELYRGHWIVRVDKGTNFAYFDAYNLSGELMRQTSFRKRDKAATFIDEVVATNAAVAPAAAEEDAEEDEE